MTRTVEEVTFQDESRLQNLSGPHEAAVSRDAVETDVTVDMSILRDDSNLRNALPAGVPQTTDPLKATKPVPSSSQKPEPLAHGSK